MSGSFFDRRVPEVVQQVQDALVAMLLPLQDGMECAVFLDYPTQNVPNQLIAVKGVRLQNEVRTQGRGRSEVTGNVDVEVAVFTGAAGDPGQRYARDACVKASSKVTTLVLNDMTLGGCVRDCTLTDLEQQFSPPEFMGQGRGCTMTMTFQFHADAIG